MIPSLFNSISSQVGCSLSCAFCHTGTQKMMRNLSTSEIMAQVILGLRHANDFPLSATKSKNLSNIVLMGQGEPLLNYKNVSNAINQVCENFNISPWRITLSTSGIAPLMGKVATDMKCSLAVSLHAVNDELRDVLVPINKRFVDLYLTYIIR